MAIVAPRPGRKRFPWYTAWLALGPLLAGSILLGSYLAWSQPQPRTFALKAPPIAPPPPTEPVAESIPMSPLQVELHERMAENSLRMKDYAEAERGYREIGHLMKDTDLAGFRIYVCLLARRQPGEAASFMSNFDEQAETRAKYYMRAADLFFDGHDAEARQAAAEGREHFPGQCDAYDATLKMAGFAPQ